MLTNQYVVSKSLRKSEKEKKESVSLVGWCLSEKITSLWNRPGFRSKHSRPIHLIRSRTRRLALISFVFIPNEISDFPTNIDIKSNQQCCQK